MTTELIPSGKDLFDNIEAYYLHDSQLAPKEKEIAERYELAFSLLLVHRNKKIVVSKLIALQHKKGKSLSPAQAYKDLNSAERIFAPIQAYSKEFLRLTIIESCIRDIKRIETRLSNAVSDKDWQNLMNQKNKVEYRLMQASGINDGSVDLPDFTKINPQQIEVDISPEMMKVLRKLTDGGRVNVTDFLQQGASDAEIID